jgi:hypothetical protein
MQLGGVVRPPGERGGRMLELRRPEEAAHDVDAKLIEAGRGGGTHFYALRRPPQGSFAMLISLNEIAITSGEAFIDEAPAF